MTRRWWLLTLALHLGFFGAWTALEEWRQTRAQVFLLETEGADPRDLWAGQYLALAFPAGRLEEARGLNAARGPAMAVKLEAAGDTVVAGKTWPLRRAAKQAAVEDGDYSAYPSAQGWARGKVHNGRVRFGIERYYFSEAREDELRKLVPGRYFALVALSPDGRLRVRRLVW